MQKTTDWLAGEAYLRDKAPELLPFINKYGHCARWSRMVWSGILKCC